MPIFLKVAVVAFGVSSLRAEPPRLATLDHHAPADLTQALERFAGEETFIPASFSVPAPSSVADLYLDGEKLGAVLARSLPFHADGFRVSLPEVAKPVMLRLVVREAVESPFVVTSVRVRVIPRESLKQALVSRTLGSGGWQLCVFGPCLGLRELLREWQLPFADAGKATPASLSHGLLGVGEVADLLHAPKTDPGSSLFLLVADPSLALESQTELTGSTRRTAIRLARGDDWRTTPKLHRLLLNHLESLPSEP